jgi:DNA (cytosine-5)-methyltransferase 1
MAVTVRDKAAILDVLERVQAAAVQNHGPGSDAEHHRIDEETRILADALSENAPAAKSGFVNIVTCLAAKIVDPTIDCRYYREPGGGMPEPPRGPDKYFVGRPISEEIIAGWLEQQSYTFAISGGWQTRTYERLKPYDLEYPENIRPPAFKKAFLGIFDRIESHGESAEEVLKYLFVKELIRRDSQRIQIAVSSIDTVSTICGYLGEHFGHGYRHSGAARLPVLALYAVYQIVVGELKRYTGKSLVRLQQHSSADTSSGAIGDIEVADADGERFEGVEVKHQIPIDPQMVRHAAAKFREHRVKRYYILTTATPCVPEDKRAECETEIRRIHSTNGCQIIVNGVLPTIRYYLRLVSNPSDFFSNYAALLKEERAIRYEHKDRWNKIIGQ